MNRITKISRNDLIKKCDEFLDGKINTESFEVYASKLIVEEYTEWENDDEVIVDIIYQWDTPEIHFPITETNIKLWKHQLKTNENLLAEYNNWNLHIEPQKVICEKSNSKWKPISNKLKIGISENLLSDPLNGIRHPKEGTTSGWYIWSGEMGTNDDFFKPICAEHLLQIRPEIIKYLGLDIGFRFLIDKNGYEDVWYDEKLLKT